MTIPPYSTYKDSGIPWLGGIPAHWEIRRNRRMFAQRNESGYSNLPILEVSLKTGVRIRDLVNSKRKQIMTDRDKYKRAVRGDLTYNMMRMWQGAVGAVPEDGLVSPSYVVARPIQDAHSRYYAYLFRTEAYMNEVNKYSRGIVTDRNRLYWDEFKQMPSIFPPPEEQLAIAEYLDEHGLKTRHFVKTRRRLIELLDEKKQSMINDAMTKVVDREVRLPPSGVCWLGHVPQNWTVRPLKRLCHINQITFPETTDPDLEIEYIDIGAVSTGRLVETPERMRFGESPSRARRVLRRGDVIFSTVASYLRTVFCIDEDRPNFIASTGFAVLTPFKNVNQRFLFYALRSDSFIDQANANSVGIAYPAIAETKLAALKIALPPTISEQVDIAHKIDSQSREIDAAIQRVLAGIELVEEYRTKLIADTVAGKRDIRHLVIERSRESKESACKDTPQNRRMYKTEEAEDVED